ncbi:MAG: aldehyde dehydrogenase family protein [Steroidobacteraceae bacterium]
MAATRIAESAPLRTDFSQLIDGELIAGTPELDVINPATGAVFARAPRATRADLDCAVAAARRAFGDWRATSFAHRREYIECFCATLCAQQQTLAELLTREQGKPRAQSRDEITRAASLAIGMASISIERELIVDDAQRRIELHYLPLGVIGVITPWNAPVNLAVGPLTMALYTGNTVVLKPSPYTPLSTLKLGELLQPLLPAGVVNVLAGGDDCGQWMSEHPGIDKISFTGSVASGKRVMASAAGTLKRVTLELGGNDAAIVLDDVDPQAIAAKLFFAAFVNSGQVCMAIKRIYAHERIYHALCEALVAEARKATVGDGLLPASQYGPIQNRMQYQRVLELLEDSRRRGGQVLAGGEPLAGDGYFLAPTIITQLPEDARLITEEQFGPLLPVQRFSDVEDAIRRANDTRYGLAASVWSCNLERAHAVAMRLEAGTVWINQHRATAANVPFGGVKESGVGRNYSEIGLKGNMEAKVISMLKT